jgi:hypothetical protein
MIVAVRAEFVRFFEIRHVFSKHFLALLANHCNLGGLGLELVVLLVVVTFFAVVPFLTAGGSDGHLRVLYVLTHLFNNY